MNGSGFASLKKRLGSSFIGIPLVVVVLYFAHHPWLQLLFVALLSFITALGMWELYRLANSKGYSPLIWEGITTAVVYLFARHLSFSYPLFATAPYVVLAFALLGFFIIRFTRTEDAIASLSVTVFGLYYVALPLGLALDLVHIWVPGGFDGRLWLGYLVVVTKMSDVGAYFCGKLLGKRRLAPNLSPKKTIAGTAGALITAIVASWLFMSLSIALLPGVNPMSPVEITLIGLLLGMMGQLGDLAESVLKRDAAVKNSSKIPGLGGILDILDSLIFATPTLYFYLLTR